MKIGIASDHAGFNLKKELVEKLSEKYKVIDFGCFSEESCDYTDYAEKVAKAVQNKEVDRGILLCATGIGMCITANKFKGVYAALCYSEDTGRLSSEHNFANVLCLPARTKICGQEVDVNTLLTFIDLWINTKNSDEERHRRRVEKIKFIEKQNFK